MKQELLRQRQLFSFRVRIGFPLLASGLNLGAYVFVRRAR